MFPSQHFEAQDEEERKVRMCRMCLCVVGGRVNVGQSGVDTFRISDCVYVRSVSSRYEMYVRESGRKLLKRIYLVGQLHDIYRIRGSSLEDHRLVIVRCKQQ